MIIHNSLEWNAVQNKLEYPARELDKYGFQLLQISKNIGDMVKELSIEEIECRRYKKQTRHHIELLAQINEEIQHYEGLLTFAVLLGD